MFSPFRCKHQNFDGSCRVYANRFQVNPRCLTIEEAIAAHCLPSDCPYTSNTPDYWGPRDMSHLWRDEATVRHVGKMLDADQRDIEAAVCMHCDKPEPNVPWTELKKELGL